ncbi:hypothetical protein ACB092_01G283400 [Castanea dentata]
MERLSSRRVGREKENEKFKGPTTVKQTSTHIQADIPQPQLFPRSLHNQNWGLTGVDKQRNLDYLSVVSKF